MRDWRGKLLLESSVSLDDREQREGMTANASLWQSTRLNLSSPPPPNHIANPITLRHSPDSPPTSCFLFSLPCLRRHSTHMIPTLPPSRHSPTTT